MRHSVHRRNLAEQVFRFSGADFLSPILASPHILKSTNIFSGSVCSLWLMVIFMTLAETCKKCVWLHVLAVHQNQNYIHTDLPTPLPLSLWSSFSSYSPHFPPNKIWHSGYRICLLMQETQRWGFGPWVRKIHWRRKWQPTPAFFSGKFHGQRSLAGYSPWGLKESDRTEHRPVQLSCGHFTSTSIIIFTM